MLTGVDGPTGPRGVDGPTGPKGDGYTGPTGKDPISAVEMMSGGLNHHR